MGRLGGIENKLRRDDFSCARWLDMMGLTCDKEMVKTKGAVMWEQLIAEREAALGRKLTPDEAVALWKEVRGL